MVHLSVQLLENALRQTRRVAVKVLKDLGVAEAVVTAGDPELMVVDLTVRQ
jgi:hypothetical protein